MSNDIFDLNIITPERTFFKDSAEEIIVDTIDGSMGILKDMAPSLIALVAGELKILKDNKWLTASNGKGFIEIKDRKVTILVETAEWPEEIETERVKKTLEENEELLRQKKSYDEYLLGKANIARALARLRVKGNQK
jgi:F-type H+-transporting ATPase subunit epsilon